MPDWHELYIAQTASASDMIGQIARLEALREVAILLLTGDADALNLSRRGQYDTKGPRAGAQRPTDVQMTRLASAVLERGRR